MAPLRLAEVSVKLVGQYPAGMADVVLAELERCGYTVKRHLEPERTVIFSALAKPVPVGADGWPLGTVDRATFPDVHCCSVQFQLLGPSFEELDHYDQPFVVAEHGKRLKKHAQPTCAKYMEETLGGTFRKLIRAAQPDLEALMRWCWAGDSPEPAAKQQKPASARRFRVTCEKHNVKIKSQDLCREFAKCLNETLQTPAPAVDLKNYDLDIVLYTAHAADEEKAAGGCDSHLDHWAIGFRRVGTDVERTILFDSPEPAAVGACVGGYANAVLKRYLDAEEARHLVVLDPMAGVGKLPLNLAVQQSHETAPENSRGFYLLGSEVLRESLGKALQHRAQLPASTLPRGFEVNQATTNRLPYRNGVIDAIVVDPPWGQRHLSHSVIQKNWVKWFKEWVRVVRRGGLIVVVTIRTKQLLHDYERRTRGKDLELLAQRTFDNCGWRQCQVLVFRRI